tara:strand:+ start:2188 stop:3291 length:1104 start_codon:yes stop_codon:yes gene_type:complete
MKVSIGSRVVEGPWGGGNLFVKNLSYYLTLAGHKVIYDLSEPDIDLIVLTDPRSRKESTSTYNHDEIKQYKKYVKEDTIVVQRINECDERKGTRNINEFYLKASNVADHVIFVSSWLEDIYLNLGMSSSKTSVILSGSDAKIFNPEGSAEVDSKRKVKLLTHHWSSNRNKGFDTYELINKMIDTPKWKDRLEFTYIGNTDKDYKLHNTKLIEPLAGQDLSNEIKNHHIYVTASINEPSGNHHIEAAQCGLPILYIQSGGIPEYCEGFGIGFTDDFEEKLEKIIKEYDEHKLNMKNYPFNADLMCKEYLDLFVNLLESKPYSRVKKNYILKSVYLTRQKIVKTLRDQLYFKTKHLFSNILRNLIKKNG